MAIVEQCNYHNGDIIDHHYEIEKCLGEGSFGIVYKVHDTIDDDFKALKILKLWAIPPDERSLLMKRFDREYETGLIESDYLVHSLNKGMAKGNPYIVMEFCPGGDLSKAVRQSNVDLSKSAVEILHGLNDLHKNGKIHRDLKPENVLIRRDNCSVLTDFGIAGDQNNRLTRTGITGKPKQIFGTYIYMPPEQSNPKRGNATVLPTTDIFSFGVMMYELLTGSLPFGPINSEAELWAYVNNAMRGRWDRTALSKIRNGENWLPLIERCLDPDFSTRIQTAMEAMNLVPFNRNMNVDSHTIDYNPVFNKGLLLRIMQGEERGKIYRLNDLVQSQYGIVTMGRRSDTCRNLIDIIETESYYISRRHCTLEWNADQRVWIIRDGQWVSSDAKWKESTNGTFLNSKEVSILGLPIHPGDIILLGDVTMRVEGY